LPSCPHTSKVRLISSFITSQLLVYMSRIELQN
jgi:hypothetical protein